MGALLFTLLGVALDVTSSSWPVKFQSIYEHVWCDARLMRT